MGKRKERFTEELDVWTQQVIIDPIWATAKDFFASEGEYEPAEEPELHFEDVKKAIRERVFDSYRAGCRATEDKLGVKKSRREKED